MMEKDYRFRFAGSRQKGILLIHGLTGSPNEMRFVGKHLNKLGFTVDAPVLAGHCLDEKALLKTRYEDWVASIQTALESFQNDVEEIYIAGICVGGALGLLAAHRLPPVLQSKIKGVVIYSPALNYDGWNTPFYYQWAPYGLPILAHVPFINQIGFPEGDTFGIKSERVRKAILDVDKIEGTLPAFPMRALYQNCRLNSALAKALPDVKIPLLLIHAREDDVCHPRNSEKIQKMYGGHCNIEWLENSYHLIHIDQERKKTAQLTADFCGLPIDNLAESVLVAHA